MNVIHVPQPAQLQQIHAFPEMEQLCQLMFVPILILIVLKERPVSNIFITNQFVVLILFFHLIIVAGAVTTTYRGCTIGCTNSTTTECCTTDLCNIITQAPVSGFQCYGCTTASNSTADDCFVGNVSSPIMISYTCPAGSNDCFMESTSKHI